MKYQLCAFTIINVLVLLVNIGWSSMSSTQGSPLLAQAEPQPKNDKVVEATEFRVLDKDGDVRIRLTCDKDSHPTMTMMNADGRQSVRLRVIADGPELELFGEGSEKAWVYCRNAEQAVSLRDKAGFTQANMWLQKGTPKIELGRGTSKEIDDRSGLVQIAVWPEGGGVKLLGNGKESSKAMVKSSFVVGCNEKGNASAGIYDENGKLLWQAP